MAVDGGKLAPILRHPRQFSVNKSVIGVHDYFSLNAQANNSLYSHLHEHFKLGVAKQVHPIKLAPLDLRKDSDDKDRPQISLRKRKRAAARVTEEEVGFHEALFAADRATSTLGALGDGVEEDGSKVAIQKQQEEAKMDLEIATHDREQQEARLKAKEMAEEAAKMAEIKYKARSGLLNDLRNGNLERIAADMERETDRQVAELEALQEKTIAAATAPGAMDEQAAELEEAKAKLAEKKAQLADIKSKAKKGLLEAKRDGSLEVIMDGMVESISKIAEEMEETAVVGAKAASNLSKINVKARNCLISAKRSGELEQIYLKMTSTQDIIGNIAKHLGKLKKQIKENLLVCTRPEDLMKVATGLSNFLNRASREVGLVKKQSQEGSLEVESHFAHTYEELQKVQNIFYDILNRVEAGIRDRSIVNAIKLRNFAKEIAAVQGYLEKNLVDLNVAKKKAMTGIIQMQRDGELAELRDRKDAEDAKMSASRKKVMTGLMKASKNKELEGIARGYEIGQAIKEFNHAFPDSGGEGEEKTPPPLHNQMLRDMLRARKEYLETYKLSESDVEELKREVEKLEAVLGEAGAET